MKKFRYSKKYFDNYGLAGKKYSFHSRNPTFNKIVSEIKELNYSGKILDIGCAEGFFLKECRKNNFEIYGVDISSYIIKKAKKMLKSGNFYIVDLINKKLPFSSNFFDVVTMIDTLEHVENPQNALREAKRVLRSKGLLHVRLPGFKRGLREPSHVNFYSPVSLRVLLEKHGFKIIKHGEEGGKFQIPLGVIKLTLNGKTNFNYVPRGTGSFISSYSIKL